MPITAGIIKFNYERVVIILPNIFESCPDKTNEVSCWTCDHFRKCDKVMKQFKENGPNFDEQAFQSNKTVQRSPNFDVADFCLTCGTVNSALAKYSVGGDISRRLLVDRQHYRAVGEKVLLCEHCATELSN